MTDKLICLDAGRLAGDLADVLDEMGYRYGYNGQPCKRRSANNMPYITIDAVHGFYSGSKGAAISVRWKKLDRYEMREVVRSLPSIEEIRERARKSDGAVDKHMRQPSKDGRKMERFWYTGTGRPMPISAMNDDHLHNTILLVDRTIDMGFDTVGNNRDLAGLLNELEDERIHRGLHLPLIPYISLEYRKGNHHA